MFDYARNMQLALADTARRTAVKAVAGVVVALGAGFLVAALWSWLATDLGWGSTLASLTIGGGFAVLGLIVMMFAGKVKHRAPTTDDLKHEIEARLDLVKDAAVDRARAEVARFTDMAENRVHSLIDQAGFRASKVVEDAERSAFGFARDTARKAGLTAENLNAAREAVDDARETVRDAADKAKAAADSNAGSMAKIIGAFAVGITLASKVQDWRRGRESQRMAEDLYDDELYDDLYDDRRA